MFARRLQPYRGTRLFAEAIRNILIKYDNLNVVIAGEGPDEEYLKAMFADNAHVTFIKYHVSESLEIHKDVDIAVIPTVGSEGTSFSLLEAMASYCAVICTNVGGMTNIIINGYNGIMINPSVKELTNALDLLVSDEATRLYLANNAYDVAKKSFSYDRWKDSWISILQNAFNI